MWFHEAFFYQIYPLGFCGAERENDFGLVRHRLKEIESEIPRLKALGVTAVLFNPLFESERHGYDTVDFFHIDRRLGTNEEFAALVKAFHEAGIAVVLDGVFHHVGRKFPPFCEVLEKGEASASRFWFYIDFGGRSAYGDPFGYENWEGHSELVKLRLENADLLDYLLRAVRFWMDEFGIDGLRLDVCYSLPVWFIELLRRTVREKREDFFLMGEVIHLSHFAQNLSPERLDSITNYECFHGMISAFNSENLFEIESSLTRLFASLPWALYPGKFLFNFADNHDVTRAYSALKEKRNCKNLYTLLFTMPGIPCVYYGSEFGAEGEKKDSDYALRPAMRSIERRDVSLSDHIAALAGLRRAHSSLIWGGYEKAVVKNRAFSFFRTDGNERILVAINIGDETDLSLKGGEGTDLFTGNKYDLSRLRLPAHSSAVIRVENL